MIFFSFQEEKLVVSGIRHFLDATLFLYREQRPDFQLRLKRGVSLFAFPSLPLAITFFFCQVHFFLLLLSASCFQLFLFCRSQVASASRNTQVFPPNSTLLPSFTSFSFWVSCVLGCGFISLPLLQIEASLLLHL